ncbi:MAG: methyltransferase domain-containing protein [Candidatus Aenigmarchaeota archaeon]|nr:methyltransferase domain-containing protein [Candidatus Aenigmarchaeota archaeon]
MLDRKIKLEAIKLANLKEGELFIDVAAGRGWVFNKLAKIGNGVAIDISFNMCRNCKKYGDSIQADAKYLPFRSAIFDVVFCSFFLDTLRISEVSQVLFEIKRILKPSGWLITITASLGNGIQKYVQQLYNIYCSTIPPSIKIGHLSCPINMERILIEHNFKIVRKKTSFVIFFPTDIIVSQKI